MNVHGPTCARLLEVALAGAAAERGRFGKYRLIVRPCAIVKERGILTVSGEGRESLTVAKLLRRRVTFGFTLDVNGELRKFAASDREVDDRVGAWLRSLGCLVEFVGLRDIEAKPDYWPSEEALELLDGSWRGEVAFFLGNLVLCAVRRFVAVRAPSESRGVVIDDIHEVGDVVYPVRRRAHAAA